MKNLLVFTFAFAVLGLAACGSETTDATDDATTDELVPTEEVMDDSTAMEEAAGAMDDAAGAMDEAADAIGDAATDAADATQEAADAVGDAVDDAVDAGVDGQ